VRDAFENGRTPIVLSGSCHTALGSFAGLPSGRRGVIWLDCHADFNTPDTTGSGLLDGTVLATIAGRCWKRLALAVPGFEAVMESDVLLVGVREVDAAEERLLAEAPIPRLTVEDVRGGDLTALHTLAGTVDSVYLHIDLDVLDPSVGVANKFAEPGGLLLRDFVELLRTVSALFRTKAIGMASYDPRRDPDASVASAAIRGVAALLM
jgi:arginase